jgi:RNA-directed DNA polymerase
MTVRQDTGAVSHNGEGWHTINWQQAHAHVRRLQARIVKATQEGKWGKVKSLQHLLTRSFYAKAIAVKRVTENKGKKTPGVDDIVWQTPQDKWDAISDLNQRGYNPKPLRRIYIPKGHNTIKKRPLGIPTMKDRAMQALYLLALESVAETTGDTCSYGFRKERGCADAIGQCFNTLNKPTSAVWVLEGDIRACFDSISHDWLLENIPMEKEILRKWLKAGYMEKGQRFPTEAGTPQGGIASPVLANMALDGLESLLQEKFPKRKGCYKTYNAPKVNLIRYADDFVITGRSKELLEHEVKPVVEAFLKTRGLELSPDKTLITHLDIGFDFLGQNIRKYNGKLLIKPSKKSVKQHLDQVRSRIKTNPSISAGKLIRKLNPVLRGWALYHRHVVSKDTFAHVQKEVMLALLRWVRRRHKNKGALWRKQKYFTVHNGHDWVFFGEDHGKEITLFNPAYLPIKRHTKIRKDANPFDPAWEMYFEKRLETKMVNHLQGRKQLIRLWKAQNGVCPVCQERITTETGWNNHHIKPRALGGTDTYENRVLLHPNCHRMIHNSNISVEKPRLDKGR